MPKIQDIIKARAEFHRRHNSPVVIGSERERMNAGLQYLQAKHPRVFAEIQKQGLSGLGDFWSNLRDKIIGDTKTAVKKVEDDAKASVTASIQDQANQLSAKLKAAVSSGNSTDASSITNALSKLLGPESAVALYNMYRIQKGQQPLSTADVLGVGQESNALKFGAYAVGAALLIWAGSAWIKKRG